MPTDRLYGEALRRMGALLRKARRTPLREPWAAALATADLRGRVTARMVLLKDFDSGGFYFYTNLLSRKGRQLAENPRGALCFYWDALLEQARIEGRVRPVSPAAADAYWASRPRESQVASWASAQSEPLSSRGELLARAAAVRARFRGRLIPRPPHWSGCRLVPDAVEFWKAGPHRLNHRTLYLKQGSRWSRRLLYP